MTYEENYLAHYGINGQKWGIRRYQNEDGTYTPEGRTRYGRGKNVDREHGEVYRKEKQKIEKENAPKEKKLYDQLHRLVDKYELDGDDGGGGNREKWSEAELQKAGKKYWELSEQIERLDEETHTRALDRANKHIIMKYGDVALSDMKHYHNVKNALAISTFLAGTGLLLYKSIKYG